MRRVGFVLFTLVFPLLAQSQPRTVRIGVLSIFHPQRADHRRRSNGRADDCGWWSEDFSATGIGLQPASSPFRRRQFAFELQHDGNTRRNCAPLAAISNPQALSSRFLEN
jgi:hypothetical protein